LDPGDTRIAEIAGDRKAENEVETNKQQESSFLQEDKKKIAMVCVFCAM
jgi:hypothetical protein